MNLEHAVINLCVECTDDVLTFSTKRNPGLVTMVESFEPWHVEAPDWTTSVAEVDPWRRAIPKWRCKLGNDEMCHCATAKPIGNARPVCVERMRRLRKGAWDDGDDFGLVSEVVKIALECSREDAEREKLREYRLF